MMLSHQRLDMNTPALTLAERSNIDSGTWFSKLSAPLRDDILARCWGAEYEGTPRTVDNFVRSLRVKLELNAEEPRHFLTVRGHGYRFER